MRWLSIDVGATAVAPPLAPTPAAQRWRNDVRATVGLAACPPPMCRQRPANAGALAVSRRRDNRCVATAGISTGVTTLVQRRIYHRWSATSPPPLCPRALHHRRCCHRRATVGSRLACLCHRCHHLTAACHRRATTAWLTGGGLLCSEFEGWWRFLR